METKCTQKEPERYLSLLEWAKKRYEGGSARSAVQEAEKPQRWLESLFELEGLGKEYWKDVDPDEFVRKLREGWE